MKWWEEAPWWQGFLIFGLGVVLFVLGMKSWIWSSLDRSIAMVTQDIADLTKEKQKSIKSIASLQSVEQEVLILREKLSSTLQQLPVEGESQDFRKEMVKIGTRAGVSIRLWKPEQQSITRDLSDASLHIVVRVEGRFFPTVQFLDELLQLSWIQMINPLILTRKSGAGGVSLVTTDFTIQGTVLPQFREMKELLKT